MPDIGNRAEFEKRLTEGLTKLLSKARQELINAVWREGFQMTDLNNLPPSVMDGLRNNLQLLFMEELPQVYIEAAENFAGILSFGVDRARLEERAMDWANDYSAQLANQMTGSTQRQIQRLSQSAPGIPISRRVLVSMLTALFNAARAQAAAITEVTHAISTGESFVTDEVNQFENTQADKVWFSQLDERVCPICAPRHGRIEGDGWQRPPPAHPNCRCYLGYRITRSDGSRIILFDDEDARILRRLGRD